MKVSIVIPSLYEKTKGYLENTVDSLRSTVDWDIIVVTNGTPVKPNLSHIKGITIHAHTSDQGQCNAVNIGAQLTSADTDYIMVSNDDMYYAPDWMPNLVKESINNWPLCWSPNLVEPVDNAGSAPPFLKFDGGVDLEAFKQDEVNAFVLQHDDPVQTDGFNLPFFIRKDVWQTIGGYDVAYDPWGSNSDTDLQTAIELAGIKPKRFRDVLVYHFGSKSGTFDSSNQELWWKNWNYYTEKWGFNRDMEPQADTWMCKDMIHWDKLKYKPEWVNKYAA